MVRFPRVNELLPRVVRDYERKFWLLWKENQDLSNLIGEMHHEEKEEAVHTLTVQLAVKEQTIQTLSAHVAEIFNICS